MPSERRTREPQPTPEAIEPGLFRPLIDRILKINQQFKGHLAITCGASTVLFRKPESAPHHELRVYGLNEKEGAIEIMVMNSDDWKNILTQAPTIPDQDMDEAMLTMTPIKQKGLAKWIENYAASKTRAKEINDAIVKRSHRKKPSRAEVSLLKEISEILDQI